VLAKITDGALAQAVTLFNARITAGNFTFQFLSQAGFSHYIESRTNVTSGAWTPRSNLSGDGLIKTISVPATSAPQFFRVKTQ